LKSIYNILRGSSSKLLFGHVLLAGLSLLSPYFVILWMLNAIIDLFRNFKSHADTENVLIISYIVGLEVVCRMVKTSPFIPYELGKYILIIFPIISGKLDRRVLLPLFCFLPAVILGFYYNINFLSLVHDVFAWFALILFGNFVQKINFDSKSINRLIFYILLGAITAVCIAFFKSPDINEIEFSYDANSEAAGGYASNQVSTLFGLGLGICGFMYLNNIRLMPLWMLLILFSVFLFRGVLTFSRGGILVGLLSVLVNYLSTILSGKIKFRQIIFLIFCIVSLLLSLLAINSYSDGMLYKRLNGETFGTEIGIKESNLNTLTSGRLEILEQDIDIFTDNIFLGVGIHQSAIIRAKSQMDGVVIASHVELSRLLSEQGILGLIFFFWLLFVFIKSFKFNKSSLGRNFILFVFCFGIITTFHSATRTFVTPFFGALTFIRIRDID
jgi:hypothetical protein